jgi:formylmethanofuran dehydrogenase subunit E
MARQTDANYGKATDSSQLPAATDCDGCGEVFAEATLFLTESGDLLCNDCREYDEPDLDAFPLNE